MIWFLIDTSNSPSSLAILKNNKIVYKNFWENERSHAETLTLKLDTALKNANITLDEITHLGVCLGPGSFTGVRVGVNLIRTLAYSFNLPVFGLDSLYLKALSVPDDYVGHIKVFSKAYGGDAFFASFEKSQRDKTLVCIDKPQVIRDYKNKSLEALKTPTLFLGDLAEEFKSSCLNDSPTRLIVSSSYELPMLSQVFGEFIICNDIDQRRFLKWNELLPLYLKASAAEENFGSK